MKTVIITGFVCVTLVAGLAIVTNVPLTASLSLGGATLAYAVGASRDLKS